MARECTLALDIGGTKIAYALVPDDSPVALGTGRINTVDGPPLIQTRLALEAGLEQAEQLDMSITRVGIGAPGVVLAPEGEIIYNGETIRNWAGSNLREVVEDLLDVPCAVHNDVRVWAYGEHLMGGHPGRVLYIALGTGVGGAIMDGTDLLDGPTGSAGEFAEIICADHAGLAVRCEDVASGTGLTRYYNDATGSNLTLAGIMQRWHVGEEQAHTIITGNLTGFGRALGSLVTLLDLSEVVIGGGVADIGDPVLDPIHTGILQTALAPNRGVRVSTTRLGPDAALIAAARYARDHAYQDSRQT